MNQRKVHIHGDAQYAEEILAISPDARDEIIDMQFFPDGSMKPVEDVRQGILPPHLYSGIIFISSPVATGYASNLVNDGDPFL